jgi:beta-glucanase (GH16 family)
MVKPSSRRRRVIAGVGVLLGAASGAVTTGGVATPADGPSPEARWALSFQDEFDGTALDADKWSSGFGWGEASRSTYGFCDPANNVVGGGVLAQRIEARPQGGMPFSVGCINSQGRFSQLYGFWEARIRVAGCRGARGAFWGKPDDESWPPELDVVEVYGDTRDEAQFTVHYNQQGRHRKSKGRLIGPDFTADFHVYGAEWSPDGVIWFVDGIERFRTHQGARAMAAGGAFYTMVETQVIDPASRCGTWPYYSSQYVDYVRVWSRVTDELRGSRAPNTR